jgi:hypothetical protein
VLLHLFFFFVGLWHLSRASCIARPDYLWGKRLKSLDRAESKGKIKEGCSACVKKGGETYG